MPKKQILAPGLTAETSRGVTYFDAEALQVSADAEGFVTLTLTIDPATLRQLVAIADHPAIRQIVAATTAATVDTAVTPLTRAA